jgi:hypothetical protein
MTPMQACCNRLDGGAAKLQRGRMSVAAVPAAAVLRKSRREGRETRERGSLMEILRAGSIAIA